MSVGHRIWDVQHGSAAHIRTPNGKNIVADCGRGGTLLHDRPQVRAIL